MGYLIPARLGDGAWMGWESSSVVVVAAAAVAAVVAAAVAVAAAIAVTRLGGGWADAFIVNWGATAPN